LLKGASLSSLLIEPVQRLPRYQLLLRELIKFCPPGQHREALTEGVCVCVFFHIAPSCALAEKKKKKTSSSFFFFFLFLLLLLFCFFFF
jgi:hypothetical protein